MTKNTMGTKLPRKLVQKMSIVGEQIELARLRRNLSVAIGIYLRVLYALQLDDDILWLAKEDKLGKALQDLSLKTRRRASKKV